MRLTIVYSKIKKRNLVLINNDPYQRETLSDQPIQQPLTMSNSLSHFINVNLCTCMKHNYYFASRLLVNHLVPISYKHIIIRTNKYSY